jgi:hypothetical protein
MVIAPAITAEAGMPIKNQTQPWRYQGFWVSGVDREGGSAGSVDMRMIIAE